MATVNNQMHPLVDTCIFYLSVDGCQFWKDLVSASFVGGVILLVLRLAVALRGPLFGHTLIVELAVLTIQTFKQGVKMMNE